MLNRSYLTLMLLAGALAIPSCTSDPTDKSSVNSSAHSEPIRLTEAPPPPGVPESALRPFDATQMELGRLTRAEIVASLAAPRYLDNLGQTPEPRDANPPLAAQKFYAAGKQALLENDNFRAVQQLEKALRLSPAEPAILKSLAEAWTRAGNRVSASNFYRQAFAADPTDLKSLFMLGRFSLDERRWDQAILNLDAALKLAEPTAPMNGPTVSDTADPAAAHLIHFYLANALNQAGHGQAAAEMFDAYLTGRPRLTGASPYAREIAILGNQRGETLMLVGDLQHRLGDPRTAWDAYAAAAEVGVLNPDTLRRRLLYTRLRLGQTRAAQELVAEAVTESRGDAKALELIPYAVAQGVSAEALSAQLTALYEERGRPASLALAMADVLPADIATPLLQKHLDENPGDDAVFGRLIGLLLGDAPSPAAQQQAVSATVSAMIASPDLAEAYADRLLANVENPATLLPHFPDPVSAASLALRGKVLLADGQTDAAFTTFSQALELDADTDLARFELAALQLDRGHFDEAEALLAPMADSTHPRVTMLRVRALTETEQTEAALTLLNDVLRRTPPGSPLMLEKADLLIKLGRVEEAERTLLDALNARPTDEAIYAALLDIYNDNGSMIRNYQRLVRRMVDTIPNARITQLVRLETLVAMRQFPQAQELLNKLEETDQDRLLILRLRLEVAIGTNQAEAVSSLLDQHRAEAKAVGQPPSEEILTLGLRYFASKKQSDDFLVLVEQHLADANEVGYPLIESVLTLAIQYFAREGDQDKVLELAAIQWEAKPPSPTRSETLGQIYLEAERYEDAVAITQEAFEQGLLGEQPLIMTSLLVRALMGLERFDDAEQHIQELAQDRPELGAELAEYLAMVYEERGDTAASRRVMEAALEDFPNHAGMNNSLGYGLAHEGIRLDDAERMIARAVAANPDTAAYLDSMGWVYYKKAEFERALSWLQRGRAADGGTHPVIIDHLGDTLYRLDRPAEAVRAWNAARAIMSAEGYQSFDPEEEDLPQRLEAKIQAVAEDKPAPVADVGQGVEIPVPAQAIQAPDVEPAVPAIDPPVAPVEMEPAAAE